MLRSMFFYLVPGLVRWLPWLFVGGTLWEVGIGLFTAHQTSDVGCRGCFDSRTYVALGVAHAGVLT